MARFVAVSLLLAAAFVAAAAAASAAVDPVVDGAGSFDPNAESKMFIQRRLLSDANGVDTVNVFHGNKMFIQRRLLSGGDECHQTCEQVHFRTLCEGLTKLPGVTTPRELLAAAVRVAIGKAKMAKSRVEAYAASAHAQNPLASMLDTCRTGYDNVESGLVEIQQLLDSHTITHADLMRKATDVTTFAVDCGDAFEERPEIKSPIAAEQKNVYRVVDNVLNIAHFVKQV